MSSLTKGTWIKVVPDFRKPPYGTGGFGLMLSNPIYHLERLRTGAEFYEERWKPHFSVVESIEEALASIVYFGNLLPQLLEGQIRPEALGSPKGELVETALEDMRTSQSPPSSLHIEARVNVHAYYLFVTGLWTILSASYAAHGFAVRYCRNVERGARDIRNAIPSGTDAGAISAYLGGMSELFCEFASKWQRRKEREENRFGSALWHRRRNVHEDALMHFFIDHDSPSKDFSCCYSGITWMPQDRFPIEPILQDGMQLCDEFRSFADDVMMKTFDLLKLHGVEQIILSPRPSAQPNSADGSSS